MKHTDTDKLHEPCSSQGFQYIYRGCEILFISELPVIAGLA
jgi:hypothetical protein